MSDDQQQDRHEQLRELLGAHVLGHLDDLEEGAVRAHLDGCAACRAEVADLVPLVARLDAVDPTHLDERPSPAAGLGARIRSAIAAEQSERDRRERAEEHEAARSRLRRRTTLLTAAAAVVVLALGAGVGLGRATAPEPPAVPLEAISLEVETPGEGTGIEVESAGLVAHTWGTELRLVGAGFEEGAVYRAAFRDGTGRLTPAGQFLGTGGDDMTCNLQSALLRADVTAVVVRDEAGRTVISGAL